MPVEYHPTRATLIDRLRAVRENVTTGDLQRSLLSAIADGSLDSDDLVAGTDVIDRHKAEEGFDEDAKLPWRREVMDSLTSARARFGKSGRNIFDMTLISPMFSRVDVDDLEIGDTTPPYPSLYLHFGENCGLDLGNGLSIEGAYVISKDIEGNDCDLEMILVCNHPGHLETDKVRLGDTFKRVTSAARCAIRREGTVAASLSTLGITGDPALLGSGNVLVQAVRMAVNGLLYLSTAKADIEYAYPEDAPESLVRKALGLVPGETERARMALEARGYRQVNFCGRRTIGPALARRETGSPEPHWRRGHWRRVVYGAGRLQREWRLFPPVIVNSRLGEPRFGRVYIVQPPEA